MKLKDCTDKVAAFLVPFKWPFVALAAFILFYDKFLSVFDSLLVLPLLSSVKPNTWIDFLMLGIGIIVCGYYLRAGSRGLSPDTTDFIKKLGGKNRLSDLLQKISSRGKTRYQI